MLCQLLFVKVVNIVVIFQFVIQIIHASNDSSTSQKSQSSHYHNSNHRFTDKDRYFMERAIKLASMANGKTAPNPCVGCVIVDKNNHIISEGFHKKAGQHHAEVEAFLSAKRSLQGATAYVSLEPCNHHGRTPPCSEALVRHGVTRVVSSMVDPDPRVSGKGLQYLRQMAVAVQVGLCEESSRELNAPFIFRVITKRPYSICWTMTSSNGSGSSASDNVNNDTNASGNNNNRNSMIDRKNSVKIVRPKLCDLLPLLHHHHNNDDSDNAVNNKNNNSDSNSQQKHADVVPEVDTIYLTAADYLSIKASNSNSNSNISDDKSSGGDNSNNWNTILHALPNHISLLLRIDIDYSEFNTLFPPTSFCINNGTADGNDGNGDDITGSGCGEDDATGAKRLHVKIISINEVLNSNDSDGSNSFLPMQQLLTKYIPLLSAALASSNKQNFFDSTNIDFIKIKIAYVSSSSPSSSSSSSSSYALSSHVEILNQLAFQGSNGVLFFADNHYGNSDDSFASSSSSSLAAVTAVAAVTSNNSTPNKMSSNCTSARTNISRSSLLNSINRKSNNISNNNKQNNGDNCNNKGNDKRNDDIDNNSINLNIHEYSRYGLIQKLIVSSSSHTNSLSLASSLIHNISQAYHTTHAQLSMNSDDTDRTCDNTTINTNTSDDIIESGRGNNKYEINLSKLQTFNTDNVVVDGSTSSAADDEVYDGYNNNSHQSMKNDRSSNYKGKKLNKLHKSTSSSSSSSSLFLNNHFAYKLWSYRAVSN